MRVIREAVECNDRERALRREAESLLERLCHAQQESEMALINLFPNSMVVAQLKAIVEYQDEYDPATGRIRITGVIQEGVYRHVINILQLLAELTEQGLMATAGINKATLLKVAIFHDLAKIQPRLEVGDVVDPKEAFEPGQLHAFRGASLVRRVHHLEQDIVHLIKYHHHEERELPGDFPPHLLSMHRLFRLLDGLSAGITRRGSNVNLKVNGTMLEVREESAHPAYNRCLELDLYSGKVELKSLDHWKGGVSI
ncbi:HD domain-containing protein [Neomoorella thermoacetica]|uniref:HD domain-containing protein n=1 Tax=Neomoorella thermoacetica TaxID=1525 RepID=UPI001E4ABFF3|nr:HD domain-containing protein [Moorella thermoacetica]